MAATAWVMHVGSEIERKFLVVDDAWRAMAKRGRRIRQGYLCRTPLVVRVRIFEDKAFLTIKSDEPGMRRTEFEYSIPLADAEEMLAQHCTQPLVEKIRYTIQMDGLEWIVDVFEGALSGRVLAEVELYAADQSLTPPGWIGQEVTDDPAYRNHHLHD